MDSLSQLVLGGAVAASIAPAGHRRAALLAGAALGTLPDLDVIPLSLLVDDPVTRMTWHRGPSHSLFLLPGLAWLIWAFFRRRGGRVAQAPRRWWWAILLALLTHPLLDAFTVYGTQLWWPLPVAPVMWSSVFIIDPLYTLWLLLACLAAAWLGAHRRAQHLLVAGLLVSSGYLGWSQLAKWQAERAAARVLATQGLDGAPRLSMPLPFNTLLWRIIVMTPEGYAEADYSLLSREAPVFRHYRQDAALLEAATALPAGARLTWFNHGFQRASVHQDTLLLTDIRMGVEPDYFFHFAVARRDTNGQWQALTPTEEITLPDSRPRGELLGQLWQRLRSEAGFSP